MMPNTEVENTPAMHPWLAAFLRFVGFVLGPVPIFVIFFGVFGHAAWVGYLFLAIIFGVICFPSVFNNLWGATRNFPRLLLVVSLLPALLFSFVLFLADDAGKSTSAPKAAKAEVPTKPKEEKVVWVANSLSNQTSRVLLGVTVSCNEYYRNGKQAASFKSNIDYTDDMMHVPVLPGESRSLRPEFKIDGNRDDLNESLRECSVSGAKFAKEDDSVPLDIRLSSKKNTYYGNYNTVATLKNKSNKELSIKKLIMACVIVNDRQKSDAEMLDYMKHGMDPGTGHVHTATYYKEVIARPYAAAGETRLEIPAKGELDVRLYKKGGMFSSDEELSTTPEFSQYKCWIPD